MAAKESLSSPAREFTDWSSALDGHRRWLRTVVFARLNDADAVDEVMQNVAVAAVRQDGRAVRPGNVTAWLYRVAVRQALLFRRQRGRAARRVELRGQIDVVDPRQTASPLDWLLADEEMDLLKVAISRVSRTDRELLLLKYTEDWSCRELAAFLGIAVSTVETRLQRARSRLRQELKRLNVRGGTP